MLKKKLTLLALPLVAAVSLQAQSPVNDPFNDPFFQDPFGDDIFKEMSQMQQKMDEMFRKMQQRINQRSARLVHPGMGMYKLSAQSEFTDKGDHYELVTNIPESKENHINIRTENGCSPLRQKSSMKSSKRPMEWSVRQNPSSHSSRRHHCRQMQTIQK